MRKRIADENLLRYNGMLIGVFELLADARDADRERQCVYRRAARLLGRARPICELAMSGNLAGGLDAACAAMAATAATGGH